MSTPIPEWAEKAAIEAAGPEHCFQDVVDRFARALLARDERAAKIADQRVSNLIDQANEFFEYRDQGSAIIVRERAIEADLIASAIRDRSKT